MIAASDLALVSRAHMAARQVSPSFCKLLPRWKVKGKNEIHDLRRRKTLASASLQSKISVSLPELAAQLSRPLYDIQGISELCSQTHLHLGIHRNLWGCDLVFNFVI